MSIEVSNVTKLYGEQKALDGISFSVKPGEIVGFLGPNGAGKSTMMKIISGYIPQNKGHVKVCGLDIVGDEMSIKQKLGYLPENNPLYYEMYIKEYLEFIGGLYGIEELKTRIDEIIVKVGLEKEQHKKIGQLSKGYKQRVGLAQAFIHNPEVLILDEPTTGLDPNQIVEIRELIKEIGKDKTVMLSTHIMQEVEAICNRAIIINEGKIVADEDVKLLRNRKGESGKLHVNFAKEIDHKILTDMLSNVQCNRLDGNSYEFFGAELSIIKKTVMQWSLDSDNEIVEMSEGQHNLEEVFRELTSKKA